MRVLTSLGIISLQLLVAGEQGGVVVRIRLILGRSEVALWGGSRRSDGAEILEPQEGSRVVWSGYRSRSRRMGETVSRVCRLSCRDCDQRCDECKHAGHVWVGSFDRRNNVRVRIMLGRDGQEEKALQTGDKRS
jgi:hypothetical protein